MNLGPRAFRFFLNLYPQYIFSRTRIKYIAPDWKECIVELKKSLLTRNYVGTTFGGSLYQAADPFFMLLLAKIFGFQDYIIWDQSAEIIFKRPARSKIVYHFKITEEQLENIRRDLKTQEVVRPHFQVEGIDQEGKVCVIIKKIIYIKKKN